MARQPARAAMVVPFTLLAFSLATPSHADDAALGRRAKQVFEANCYLCHGRGGRNEGGFNVVVDLRKLVATRRVVPGDPLKSKVFKRMADGDMPPEFDDGDQSANPKPLPRPSKDDVAAVEAWIKAGAPGESEPGLTRSFIAEKDLLERILKDLEGVGDRDRPYARYFTITHLYNAGLNQDQLLTYRNALSKLVNSLSWGRRVVVPRPIDPTSTVFRIDLRDLRWDEAVWKAVLAQYPFGVTYSDIAARSVYKATGCDLPYVRADWFVFAASKPPLYHEVLQLPKTDRELEAKLDVDVAANIRQERVARAAFNSSGVSRNNRMIERHESSFGAYWKSYDFAGNVGRQKLLTHPLGPGQGPHAFQHDGGEIIFNLPNGFQAYMLTRADGSRLDKGPTNIVLDKEQADSAVVNGVSCMRCHKYGMISKADQVRELAELAGVFPEGVAKTVKALYPPKETFEGLLKEDADRFAKAVRESKAPLSETEPIFELARQFENELDLSLAAAEAGQKPEPFRKLIAQSTKLVDSLASLLVPGGTVKRDTYLAAFPDVVAAVHHGRHLATSAVPIPFPTTATNSLGMKFASIPAGLVRMGSENGDSDEKPVHSVRITRPFYLGVYEVTQEEFRRLMGRNPSQFSPTGGGKHKVAGQDTRRFPVETVTWFDAVEFCNRLSTRENAAPYYRISGSSVTVAGGSGYRLPTEAEWEYACRAGTVTTYSFGDDPSRLVDFAWFEENSNGQPHPVGEKPANAFGLHDMHGNVFEWCWDRFAAGYYRQSPPSDPTGPEQTPDRVRRGAGWSFTANDARSPNRAALLPATPSSDLGFRVARTQAVR